MATIGEALAEARRTLTGLPNVVGISSKADRIIVYATSPENIPTTILGFPVEVIITPPFRVM
jgi:hypothetical protein